MLGSFFYVNYKAETILQVSMAILRVCPVESQGKEWNMALRFSTIRDALYTDAVRQCSNVISP